MVRTLDRGRRDAGEHAAIWDGLDEAGQAVASGTYYARLSVSGNDVMQTLIRRR